MIKLEDNKTLKRLQKLSDFIYFVTNFLRPSVLMLFGRSRGRPMETNHRKNSKVCSVTEGSIKCQRCKHTNCSRYTEENSVVVHFSKTVVLQQHTTVCINIWPWVGRLSVFFKNTRNKLKKNSNLQKKPRRLFTK